MRWWWVALLFWIACRDPGHGPVPVVVTLPPSVAVARPSASDGAFTQPPMPKRFPLCEGVTCSGHGRCITRTSYPYLSGDEDALCRCDPGFHAYGLECVACTPVDATHNIALRVARFRGRITWNGGELPKDLAGEVYIVSEGDVGTRGDVELGRGRFDVGVLEGRYDIVLRSPAFRADTEIVIARDVAIGGTTSIDIALPLERVTPRLTYASAAPAVGSDQGRLELVHGDDHVWVEIERAPANLYLPRGPFAVTYHPPRRDEPSLPALGLALHTATVERGELVIDVPIVRVSGTVSGLTAPFDPALTMIAFATPGDPPSRVALASPEFSAVLVRGRYDVWLTTKLRSRDLSVRIASSVEITGTRLDLAMVPPTRLHGRFLINSTVRDTVLVAIGEDSVWGAARIPLDADGRFSATLPRGAYTLAVEHDPSDSMSGVITLDRINLTNELRWELDLPMHQVSATVMIDGAPATAPTAGMGELVLRSIASPVSYGVWPTAGTLPAGSYVPDFEFGWPEPAGFPAAGGLPTAPVAITSPTTLTFELSTRRLSGTLTMDGKRSKSQAAISIDGAHVAELSAGRYATIVVPGTYAVSYFDSSANAEKRTPRNGRFSLGCITVR
ncbi:MAG: hypothetical protein H0T42_17460 [Deltaproteobacteria bacterium]|nr:hypothetical protein [Deltaproteobacteria bacterium]